MHLNVPSEVETKTRFSLALECKITNIGTSLPFNSQRPQSLWRTWHLRHVRWAWAAMNLLFKTYPLQQLQSQNLHSHPSCTIERPSMWYMYRIRRKWDSIFETVYNSVDAQSYSYFGIPWVAPGKIHLSRIPVPYIPLLD